MQEDHGRTVADLLQPHRHVIACEVHAVLGGGDTGALPDSGLGVEVACVGHAL